MENNVDKREYRISSGWRLFMLIGGIALTILFTFICIKSIEGANKTGNVFVLLLCASAAILIVIGTIYLLSYKISINDNTIIQKTIFKTCETDYKDIVGFKMIPNAGIMLYTNTKKKVELSIYLEKYKDLINWAFQNFKSMDVEEVEKEVKEIMQDVQNDYDKELIINKYEKARKIIKFLDFISIVVAFWAIFWPRPYELVIAINALLPIISLILMFKYKGIVFFNENKKSIHPSVATLIIMPSLALALRAIQDFHIIYSNRLYLDLIVFTLFSTGVFYTQILQTKEYKKYKAINFLLPLFMMIYSFGIVININCIKDKSNPILYTTSITNKSLSSGKRTTYYLKTSPWGGNDKESKISVSKNLYNSVSIGDDLFIFEKSGNLGIHWFVPIKKK